MTLFAETVEAQKFLAVAKMTRCNLCGRKSPSFTESYIIPTGNPFPENICISGEWAFHLQDTHGIPYEFLPTMTHEAIFGVSDV